MTLRSVAWHAHGVTEKAWEWGKGGQRVGKVEASGTDRVALWRGPLDK